MQLELPKHLYQYSSQVRLIDCGDGSEFDILGEEGASRVD